MTRFTVDVNEMVRSAASLADRIAHGVFNHETPGDDSRGSRRLTLWLDNSCQGNASKFDQRLAWEGLNAADAKRVLSSDPEEFRPVPFWVPMMRELLAGIAAPSGETAASIGAEVLERTPFGAALVPLVAFGMRRLRQSVPEAQINEASGSLQVQLLWKLAGICDLALGEEFLRFRSDRGYQFPKVPREQPNREMYGAFLSSLDHDGLAQLLQKYPVLARLAATAISFWVDETATFLRRLRSARPEIERRFFGGKHLPGLRTIHGSLSDPHKRGLTVKIVEFEDGRKIVYKPKSLDIDQAWFHLCAWLREHDPALDLRAPKVWNCGDYGWAEYIEHSGCASLEEIRGFYRRAGMLTALFYACQSTDFHYENLIAAGEYPVAIDLETLFVPESNVLKGQSELITRKYLRTVLQSLMLPAWQASAGGKSAYDTSGLGTSISELNASLGLGWAHQNTDDMQLAAVRVKVTAPRNLPFLAGCAIDPGKFVPEIVSGFELMYRFQVEHRDALLAFNGPMQGFRNCSARVVFRPTRVYAALLRRSLAPRLLVNGIERSLAFEGLNRTLVAQAEAYGGRTILRAELEALEQLDIPYFEAETGSTAVRSGDGIASQGLLAGPSFDSVVTRIRTLSEADLQHQVELIEASFAARNEAPRELIRRREESSVDVLTAAGLITRAEAIGEAIARRAIWEEDAAYWIGLDWQFGTDKHVLTPVGPWLYGGRGGIAIFFAALYKLTRKQEYRRLALGAVRSIANNFFGAEADPEMSRTVALAEGIGGTSGIGSVVYSLRTVAKLIDDPSLIEEGHRFAQFLSEPTIAADRSLDVIAGAAGAILGLVALWKESREPSVLRQIETCARRLVQRQEVHNGTAGGWISAGLPRPLAGFSHGAAGIAYALFSAYATTPDPQFSEAAFRGLEFERSLFLPDRDNWRDDRQGGSHETRTPIAWCNGAPGIGLARLSSLHHDHTGQMRADIEAALRCVQVNPMSDYDHVCCGEFGRIEFLLVAGERLGRPELVADARRRAACVVARAAGASDGASGYRSHIGCVERPFVPGFFQGLAGIGYQMLRVAAPKDLPSVLLWE